MTVENHIKTELVNHGLWPNEAEIVIESLKQDLQKITIKWNDDCSGYPPFFITNIFSMAKVKAIEYIDKNAPNHFARNLLS